MSQHTFWCRDMAWLTWGRDLNLVSRPGLGMVGGLVSRHSPWCCDRPGMGAQRVATRRQASSQLTTTRRSVCAVHTHCACDPPVAVHCVVYYLGHCLEHCFRTLFLDHCSFKKEIKYDPRDLGRHNKNFGRKFSRVI